MLLLLFSSNCFSQRTSAARQSALVLLSQGDNDLRRSDVEGAIKKYTNAILVDPSFAEAYMKRANVYSRIMRSTEALEDYNKKTCCGF